MASVRAQIFAAVAEKLADVVDDLEWTTFRRNPRDQLGADEMNGIVMMDGGDREPDGLTGGVGDCMLEFSVGMIVVEKAGGGDDAPQAEDMLDNGFVAISDKLLDPADIQLGGLAVGIDRGAISDPVYGRPEKGAQWFGGQVIDFTVRYFEREGDATSVGP